ncbi:Flp pilus assembly protein CpaB [Methylophaga sp. OBS3]|uniref:Flp pilus assembly protein CpaB n=1 Tax=Methylophaga sp. OBS3 TaxID=2991934 RepID=UPI0022514A12|nr:Flp pilus assembly protein CpaB [Methylophaga sp. OBS3]MCX4189651.1 Flp pilus assembly protein CpaB [Methylophaga sp. OBS3]
MSSSVLRIMAVLLALGALALGYMGYQASHAPTLKNENVVDTPPPEPIRMPVLVAAQDISTDQQITEDDVTVMFMAAPPAHSYSTQQQVINRQVKLPIAAGDLILEEHFHDFSHLVNAIRAGERAIAIRVDEVTGVGGFIQPGDYVDVLLYLAAGNETGNQSSAQRILSAARVLAYGNSVDTTDVDAISAKSKVNNEENVTEQPSADTATKDVEEEEPTGKQSKTAVLAVKDQDISALLLAESAGRLRLALLGPEALSAHSQTDKHATETAASEQKAKAVTLEAFGVTPFKVIQNRPVSGNTAVTQPAKPKVTVHRGVDTATVSVDREN